MGKLWAVIKREYIERIVEAVNILRERYDYLFTTGGIGPTHDDITTDAVAKAFGVKVELNKEAEKILQKVKAQIKAGSSAD